MFEFSSFIKKHGSFGKFSTQSFEHKNKISKENEAKNTNHGGGNIENYVSVEKQLLWIDIVRSNLSNHSDVIQPYISKKRYQF